MSQYGTAARLCLMFAVADVDHYALTATSTELELRAHRKRKTAALEKISEVNNISIDDLHQDKRKSRNYFELLFGLGPGSLLLIGPLTGPDAASWEVNTNKEDVGLVLEYIRIHLPRLYDTLIELNGVGARTMVKGLLAYGWTVEEVKSSPVPFMKAVRKHLDENLMIPMTEGVVPATQHPYTTNLSSKRKADKDHAHKFYTSNQSSSAFDDHTAETSPPDEDSIESWLLANSLQKSNSSGSSQRQLVSMDPHMTSSLYAVDCLPSSLEQDPSRERVLTIDPNMMSTLGAVGGLPSSLEPSSSRERVLTINPNLLTIDPSMTSSLGAVDCLHLWSEIQVGRGCSQCTQT
ncbi:hypothetical protein BKA65DRAFT_14162 [Rhexocercosporidium sp. MPI-PUGE-AT-0058]|nr:hypothetical protein BKA65DRAFT_14162 [Rhexocercosporidium sp. MPI-PUGE-AT-0058]